MSISCSVEYLGLQLNSPLVIGACTLTRTPETVRELAIAGAGAVVLPSLFQEQVEGRECIAGRPEITKDSGASDQSSEKSDYSGDFFKGGLEEYLDLIATLKTTTGIPILASLNGATAGDWLQVAREMESVGATAIEANLEPSLTGHDSDANQVESMLIDSIASLCSLVSVPVSVKLSPYHTNLCHLSWRLKEVGAAGIVCFNHEPTWSVHLGCIGADPEWGLTPASMINPTISGVLRARLHGPQWSLAASGGISSIEDVIAAVIAGADVVMITSEVYRSGPDIVAHLLEALCGYLNRHSFKSFAELISSRPRLEGSLRDMQLGCLTKTHRYRDPTPHASIRRGDRWGHVT